MNKKESPIVVAQIMGKWVGGGVESVIMNYYRHIDRSKIQFDFICDSDSTNIPYEEIESLGGKVILCPPYQKLPKYIRELKRIFKENKYKIVHSNINTLSVFPLYAAKRAGVPVRIAHSHSTIVNNRKEWKRNILKNILKHFSRLYATDYFACSEQAAISQFGKKTYNTGNIRIINNAIELEKFSFNQETRTIIRNKLNIKEDEIVVGHIGRFVETKNHKLIIEIFNKLYEENKKYKLMLIGQGPLEEDIKKRVKILNLEERVMFLGQKNDAFKYYQAMDAFLFPSLYEGLGMVMIEAQCSGLPCVASTEVPEIVKVSNKISFIDLDKPINEWIKNIENMKNSKRDADIKLIREKGFDIKLETKKLENEYISLIKTSR